MSKLFLTLFLLCAVAQGKFDKGYHDGGFSMTEFDFKKAHDEVTTTDATQTAAFQESIPTGETWLIEVTCHADGNNRETFKKFASISNVAGTTSLNGDIINSFLQPGLNYSMTIAATTGEKYEVLVTGLVSDTVKWRCHDSAEIIS